MKIPQKLTITLVLIVSLLTIASPQQWYQHGNPHFINQQDFQNLVINPQTRNKGVTMLKFFTPWCRYCKYLKDIIDDLKAKDSWAITIYEVNCDDTNHMFCGKMGVHSFPKMKVFQNGNLVDNMDGFYPYEVVKELFLKYNRTQKVPEHLSEHRQATVIDLTNEETTQAEGKKQEKHQEANFVQPQVVVTQGDNHQNKQHQQPRHEEPKHNQHKEQEKPVEIPVHHAQQTNTQSTKPQQTQHHNVQEPTPKQPPKQQHPTPKEPQKHTQQVKSQQAHIQPIQTAVPQLKKPEQMIEQQQNIAVMDQDRAQTQKQKKIIQDMSTKPVDTIDLTKILPGQQHIQYGKYIIYAICILVGGYYFVHIMKAQPASNESVKSYNSSTKQSTQKGSITQIPSRISIEDSQLSEELHFQHPNQEEINFNSVTVRDQDL